MKLRYSIWILWTTLACTTAPNIIQSPYPPVLSFVLSSTGIYELEDTPALIWRRKNKPLTEQAFYFSRMILACSDMSPSSHTIEKGSTTESLTFIYDVLEPKSVRELKNHPLFCQDLKKYLPSAVPIIRLDNEYVLDPKMKGNRSRQEFSVGYEVLDDCGKLNKKSLLPLERYKGLAKGSGWLEAFKVVYDAEKLIAKQVSYELNFLGVSETAPGYCENFDLKTVYELFKGISFRMVYNRSSQIGDGGSLSSHIRPKRPQSQSVKRANVSTSPSSSSQNESKKPRIIVEPEGSQPRDEEMYDNGEIQLIHNTHSLWNGEEYFGVITFRDCHRRTTTTPSSNTEGKSSKFTELPERGPAAIDEPSAEEYMVMQQLAPIEYFDVFTIQWSTCTYLNVAPMWRSLASGPWKRVDQAIRKMLYVIDKLSIIAGTYGELKLPKRNSNNQYEKVFLKSNDKKISVPGLFFKFVTHKVLTAGTNAPSLLYAIIIVMHNNFGEPTNRICSRDPANLCFQYGWDVGSEDDEIAKPYCCKPSTETLNLFDITSYSSPINDLDLNSVVLEITGDGENVVRNYNQFLNKEYEVVAKKKGKTKKLNDIYF